MPHLLIDPFARPALALSDWIPFGVLALSAVLCVGLVARHRAPAGQQIAARALRAALLCLDATVLAWGASCWLDRPYMEQLYVDFGAQLPELTVLWLDASGFAQRSALWLVPAAAIGLPLLNRLALRRVAPRHGPGLLFFSLSLALVSALFLAAAPRLPLLCLCSGVAH